MGQKPLEVAPADSAAAAILSAKRDASNIPNDVLAKTSGVSPTRMRSIAGMLPTLPSVCAEADALGVFVRWVPLPEGRRGAWHAGSGTIWLAEGMGESPAPPAPPAHSSTPGSPDEPAPRPSTPGDADPPSRVT